MFGVTLGSLLYPREMAPALDVVRPSCALVVPGAPPSVTGAIRDDLGPADEPFCRRDPHDAAMDPPGERAPRRSDRPRSTVVYQY